MLGLASVVWLLRLLFGLRLLWLISSQGGESSVSPHPERRDDKDDDDEEDEDEDELEEEEEETGEVAGKEGDEERVEEEEEEVGIKPRRGSSFALGSSQSERREEIED